MPYPNEHAQRINAPDKYIRIRRENDYFRPGIHVIWGVTRAEKAEIQAIRFDRTKFSVDQAKKWLLDHNFPITGFEPATGKESVKKVEYFETVIQNF